MNAEELSQWLENSKKEMGVLLKEVKGMSSWLKSASRSGDVKNLALLTAKLEKGLVASALAPAAESKIPSLLNWRREALSKVSAYLEAERQRLAFEFSSRLREGAEERKVLFSLLSSAPQEYMVGKFTVLPDYDKGSCRIQYARVDVGESPLDTAIFWSNLDKLSVRLNRTDFSAEDFFCVLYRACARLNLGKPQDSRVELMELLPEVAFLCQGAKFRRNPSAKNFAAYDRAQLAWDIARMRSALGMEYKGHRFNLGTATIGQTKHKDSVLYLEEGGTRGQYYMSAWFTKAD